MTTTTREIRVGGFEKVRHGLRRIRDQSGKISNFSSPRRSARFPIAPPPPHPHDTDGTGTLIVRKSAAGWSPVESSHYLTITAHYSGVTDAISSRISLLRLYYNSLPRQHRRVFMDDNLQEQQAIPYPHRSECHERRRLRLRNLMCNGLDRIE